MMMVVMVATERKNTSNTQHLMISMLMPRLFLLLLPLILEDGCGPKRHGVLFAVAEVLS